MANEAFNQFGDLDGVGPNIAMHLWDIGMRTKEDIAAGDPEDMYARDAQLYGGQLDRCVLYVYRCVHAVCHAETQNKTLDPALHKWWNWSDKNIAQTKRGIETTLVS